MELALFVSAAWVYDYVQATSRISRMIPFEEATDLWIKLAGAASIALTAMGGGLVWVVKKQMAKGKDDSKALVDQLKSSNATTADHLRNQIAVTERHHSENQQQARDHHREREDRAKDQFQEQKGWHEEIMMELLRGRDRDHDFRTIQGKLAAAVARSKTNTEEEFNELLEALLVVDNPDMTFSSAKVWQEKQRQARANRIGNRESTGTSES